MIDLDEARGCQDVDEQMESLFFGGVYMSQNLVNGGFCMCGLAPIENLPVSGSFHSLMLECSGAVGHTIDLTR
jgi:hypothetical protein